MSTSQKIEEIEKEIPKHNKYITANKFNKLTKENFAAWLKLANVERKNYFVVKKDRSWWKILKKLIIKLLQTKQNM